MKYFPKWKLKIKLKSFNSPWMTKALVKSSKKKQRFNENVLKNRNPEKELNYKHTKHFSNFEKEIKERLLFRSC